MEKILKHHDKENMKRAMLEQEETFTQQVHELHRLYRVQKQLMKEIKINKFRRDLWSPKNMELTPRRLLDLELPAEAYIQYNEGDVGADIKNENEIELTLAVGSSGRKKEETSNNSDCAGSFSSSSAESGSLKLLGHVWGLSEVQDRIQKPPWLFPRSRLTMS